MMRSEYGGVIGGEVVRVRQRIWLFLSVVSLLALSSGCAVNRATATVSPDTDLSKVKSFYVVQAPADKRGIETLISDNLVKRGFSSRSGMTTSPPPGTDAVVTYNDRWMWDITMYMVELTITLRNPQTSFPMATGNSYHTSLTRKTPAEMVDEVLGNIFGGSTKK